MNLNRVLKKCALTLALASAFGVTSAMAVTFEEATGAGNQAFSVGALGDLWVFSHADIVGSFSDTISFSLSQAANFGFSSLTHYMGVWSDISSFSVTLDGNAMNVASFFGGVELSAGQLQLPRGAHNLTIAGFGSGAFPISGGSYQFQMSASPVPEPESWALLLGGLGLVGVLSRRRIAVSR